MLPSVPNTELSDLIKKLVFQRFLIERLANKSYFKFIISNTSSTTDDRFIINMRNKQRSLFDISDISDLVSDDYSAKTLDDDTERDATRQKIYKSIDDLQQLLTSGNFDHVDKHCGYDIDSVESSVNTGDVDELISNVTSTMNSIEKLPLAIQNKIQAEIIRQAKQAFKLSRKAKNIAIQLETERIVLLAGLKQNAIVEKMNSANEEDCYSIFDTLPVVSMANVTLRQVVKCAPHEHDPIYNFLIVAWHKNSVFASKLIEFGREVNFELPESFLFRNIDLDFEIHIVVYVINKSNFINEANAPKSKEPK